MTVDATEVTSVALAFNRMRGRSTNVLVVVEGEDAVRIMNADSVAALNAWRNEPEKVAGVFNADTTLIDLRDSVQQVAHELNRGVAA